jgi:hypothetical protein
MIPRRMASVTAWVRSPRAELGQNGLHVSFDGIFRHFEKLPNTFV